MKKALGLIISFVFLLSLIACSGNLSQVNLKNSINIPKDGIIEKSVFDEIKNDNAIAVFKGESNGIEYNWTIIGKELKNTRAINLSVELNKTQKGIKIKFVETKDLGFTALLSIHIKEKWNVDRVAAYYNGLAVYSVSITGQDNTVLNLSVNKIHPECEILPNENSVVISSSDGVTSKNAYSSNTPVLENFSSSLNSLSSKNKIENSSKATMGSEDSSNETSGKSDKYNTDPIPEGKPVPVEPENTQINNKKVYSCTFSIECISILNNISQLNHDKRELIPADGIILEETQVNFYEGESVFDLLQRVCEENGIHLESEWTPMYNSAYIEGIGNLYEFDCGELSGWQYRVDGWYPNYGCSRYKLTNGAKVEFRYTCNLGKDIGNDWMG